MYFFLFQATLNVIFLFGIQDCIGGKLKQSGSSVGVVGGVNPVKSGSEQRGWRSSPDNEIIGCSGW